jgi:hypothetical protein
MVLCPACSRPLPDDATLCPQHFTGPVGGGWAASNRIMCDFFHRGVTPPRLAAAERLDEFARHRTVA